MASYKLKSLLYLVIFALCAWVYYQVDAESDPAKNQPVAGASATQAQPVTTASNGL